MKGLGEKVKFRLIGNNDIVHPQECFFKNRGVENIYEYQHLDDNCLIPHQRLDNIDKAVKLYLKHLEDKITIVVDCDADGYTSAAMIYQYTKRINPNADITYLLHTGKQHGLSADIQIPGDTKLLIIPDAGSNDVSQCEILSNNGVDILILDHHQVDIENPWAVIVNNQISKDYSNKDLCGAGIIYKFLQAVDDEMWEDKADDYLDLVALANISDLMDVRSFETKRLIEKGLKFIVNKCFQTFIDAQSFSIGGRLNMKAIAFSITPLINAMCRCGSQEEKDILFRAFIETNETFKYKKRNDPNEVTEDIYNRAVRLCKNVKARQDKVVKKLLPDLCNQIETKSINNDPVMFVRLGDNVSNVFTGLVAMKLADKYKKSTLLLHKSGDNIYSGSARNFDNSPILNLKDTLLGIGGFEFCQGHDNAFGCKIKKENILATIKQCREKLKDLDFGEMNVDFELDFTDFDIGFIHEIDDLTDFYGTGIKQPLVVINNIMLERIQGTVMGKDNSTWKFITNDNIAFIKFKNSENDNVLNFIDSNKDKIIINAICDVSISDYKGVRTPQAIIKSYEVVEVV